MTVFELLPLTEEQKQEILTEMRKQPWLRSSTDEELLRDWAEIRLSRAHDTHYADRYIPAAMGAGAFTPSFAGVKYWVCLTCSSVVADRHLHHGACHAEDDPVQMVVVEQHIQREEPTDG